MNKGDSTGRCFAFVHTAPSADYTPLALETFFSNTPLGTADIVGLIDNDGSFEDSVRFPKVEVVRNPKPLGFAANLNQMLRRSWKQKTDLFFLNNDLAFTPNWCGPIHPIPLDQQGVILSPVSNREIVYRTESVDCTVEMRLDQYVSSPATVEAIAQEHRRLHTGYMNVLNVPFFAVLLPWSVTRVVGLADEAFGQGGGEDYDYCLRAILVGYHVRYAVGSYIIHFGGKSSWSGVESREAQLSREAHFIGYFQTKWGEPLTRLLFHEAREVLTANAEPTAAAERGDLKLVVQRLMNSR